MRRIFKLSKGISFFEVGFGSLLLSVLASKLGASSVKGSELDDTAIELANHNARINGMENFEFTKADLFPEGLEPQDVIVANVPQTPQVDGEDNIHIDAGPDGTDILLRFLEKTMTTNVLAPDGTIWICVASIANAQKVFDYIESQGFAAASYGKQELPIPPYVQSRLDTPHFKHLIDKGEIFQKDGEWCSRDIICALRKK